MQRSALVCAFLTALSAAAAPPAKYTESPVANAGSIAGTVKFLGAAPARAALKIDKDMAVCGQGGAKLAETLVVSPSKGLKNAVVTLEGITQGKKLPPKTVTLDQKNCVYAPHVVVATSGSQLVLLNGDGVMHNVHAYSLKNTPFNESIPASKKSTKPLNFSEVVKVGCDVHKWMGAWVVIVDHPYYAITDENGAFKLDEVPPGKYTLRAWHETLGKVEKEVTVAAGQAATIDFQMSKR